MSDRELVAIMASIIYSQNKEGSHPIQDAVRDAFNILFEVSSRPSMRGEVANGIR